jgi:hypothetical protein
LSIYIIRFFCFKCLYSIFKIFYISFSAMLDVLCRSSHKKLFFLNICLYYNRLHTVRILLFLYICPVCVPTDCTESIVEFGGLFQTVGPYIIEYLLLILFELFIFIYFKLKILLLKTPIFFL